MATASAARSEAANNGEDVTPYMASDKETKKVTRIEWTDKGPIEKEYDFVEPRLPANVVVGK